MEQSIGHSDTGKESRGDEGDEGSRILPNFGGLSPQQDRQRVLCRGLSYKVAPLGETPWRQPLPLGEDRTLR
jgi:hypothetical protein